MPGNIINPWIMEGRSSWPNNSEESYVEMVYEQKSGLKQQEGLPAKTGYRETLSECLLAYMWSYITVSSQNQYLHFKTKSNNLKIQRAERVDSVSKGMIFSPYL